MNDLLEAKLSMTRIKVKLLDLAGELIADDLSDKEYAIKRLLGVVEYIEEYDIEIKEIYPTLPQSKLS
jgi:anaerobic ribonucleoside-triphosphate reductase